MHLLEVEVVMRHCWKLLTERRQSIRTLAVKKFSSRSTLVYVIFHAIFTGGCLVGVLSTRTRGVVLQCIAQKTDLSILNNSCEKIANLGAKFLRLYVFISSTNDLLIQEFTCGREQAKVDSY